MPDSFYWGIGSNSFPTFGLTPARWLFPPSPWWNTLPFLLLLVLKFSLAYSQVPSSVPLEEYSRIALPFEGSQLQVDIEGNLYLLSEGASGVMGLNASDGYQTARLLSGLNPGYDRILAIHQFQVINKHRIYLFDSLSQSLWLYSSSNAPLGEISFARGENPTSMSVTPSSPFYPGGFWANQLGEVYVLNTYDQQILKFDPKGHELLAFGGTTFGGGSLTNVIDLTGDHQGNLWVWDQGDQRIKLFDPWGNFIHPMEITPGWVPPLRLGGSHFALLDTTGQQFSIWEIEQADQRLMGSWTFEGLHLKDVYFNQQFLYLLFQNEVRVYKFPF